MTPSLRISQSLNQHRLSEHCILLGELSVYMRSQTAEADKKAGALETLQYCKL